MKRLDRTEELDLIASAQSGDQEAAHKLLDAMRDLVARRVHQIVRTTEFDDYLQVGLLHCWRAILAFDASSRVRLSTLVYRYVGNGLRDELRRQYRSVRAVCVDDVYAADTVPPYDARLAESEFEMVRLRCVSIAIDRLSSGERSILDSYRTGERLRDVGSRLGLSRQDVSQQRKVVAARVRDAVQNMERAR